MVKKKVPADDEEVEVMPPGKRASLIMRIMSTYGFAPHASQGPHVVEYARAFDDKNGRQARVTLLFNRGKGGLEHAQLQGAYITIVARVAPRLDALKHLPSWIKPILDDVFSAVLGLETPTAAVVRETCTTCGDETTDYCVDARKKVRCIPCFKVSVGIPQ